MSGPDSVLGSDDKARYKTLPRAIKVEFQHRVYGSLYRIYDLPKTVALQKDSNAGAGGETGGTGEGTGDNSEMNLLRAATAPLITAMRNPR